MFKWTVLISLATVLITTRCQEDDFWSPPEPDTQCQEPGQGLQSGRCGECPAGRYNFEGSRVDNCIPCPIGHFSGITGSTYCIPCEEALDRPATTRNIGSTSIDDCIDPDEVIANFAQATVTLQINVAGKDLCTGIDNLLWGLSNVMPWDGHFTECRVYEEDTTITEMEIEITPPAKYAWSLYSALQFVQVHTEVASAYAKMGSFYADRLMTYVNYLSDIGGLAFLGFEMNPDLLEIDDIELRGFRSTFHGHCRYAARIDDYFCTNEPDDSKDLFPRNYYAVFTVSDGELDCSSNAGRIKLKNKIDKGADIIPCHSRTCELSFIDCTEDSVYVLVTELRKGETIDMDEETGINTSEESSWTYQDGDSTVQFVAADYQEGCNTQTKGTTIDDLKEGLDSTSDSYGSVNCRSCEAGSFINQLGICQKCPFGSWGDDGIHCNSCGWHYSTPFWGMEDEEKCIETNNWEEVRDSIYKDWESYLQDSAGNNWLDLAVTPTINMCGPVHAKKDLDAKCNEMFSEDELTWPEEINLEDWTIQQIICSGSTQVESAFAQICGNDWDKSMEEIEDEFFDDIIRSMLDVACFGLKRVKDLENADTSDDCSNLNEDEYEMRIPIELPKIGIDMGTSAVLVPLFSVMDNLETMDFSSFADAGEAMMKSMGMYDMNALIGWDTANNLRDIMMTVPSAFSVRRFSFSAEYDESLYFCESGEAKRRCDFGCDSECARLESDMDIDLECERDECNNCAQKFYYYDAGRRVEFDRCVSCVTEFEAEIENAVLKRIFRNNVEAQYTCNDGWVAEDCNSRAVCDYKSGVKTIQYPTCVRDMCDWPSYVDNGEFYSDWRSDEYMDADACPFKTFRCFEGYYPEDSDRIQCNVGDDFKIYRRPECNYIEFNDDDDDDDDEDGRHEGDHDKEGCYFPDFIDGGKKIEDYEFEDRAYYECYKPYVITPNKRMTMGSMSSSVKLASLHENFNVGYCSGDEMILPECIHPEEAGHCGLPKYIKDGKAVQAMFPKDLMRNYEEFYRDDYEYQYFDDDTLRMMREVIDDYDLERSDELMPFMARYLCDDGYVMVKTVRGDMGWCRKDNSMEIPRCLPPSEFFGINFRLVESDLMKMVDKNGNVFGGIVQAMMVNEEGGMEDPGWEYGCNDGFNNNAAGAICRTQGFQHGTQVLGPMSKKVKFMKAAGIDLSNSLTEEMSHSFGWTNFACDYDDTLAESDSCRATRYEDAIKERGMKAVCFDFDKMAVKCFNDSSFGVNIIDVKFTKKKIICNAQGSKKGYRIDLGTLNLTVKLSVDDQMIEPEDISVIYKKKKGYMAKYDLRRRRFDCITCEIHAGTTFITKETTCK